VHLNSQQFGAEGQPLIILHGLFGSARNWRGIAQKLSKTHCVYTLDLRNHGSSPHVDDMSYQVMADDVAEFMRQQNITCAQVLGHSMGGKVAMQLALSRPELLSQLVVVDMAPVKYGHDFDNVLEGLRSINLASITSRIDADKQLAKTLEVLSLRQFLLQNLVSLETGGYAWRVNLDSIESNMLNIMGFPEVGENTPFKKSTLFIGGGNSSYLSARYLAAAKALFPNASVEMLKGVGHWPQVEAPKAFLGVIEPFLNQTQ
jgi:esterase